jgi:hypothetical protein
MNESNGVEVALSSIRRIYEWLWEIPRSYRNDMRVPARNHASEVMLPAGSGMEASIDYKDIGEAVGRKVSGWCIKQG